MNALNTLLFLLLTLSATKFISKSYMDLVLNVNLLNGNGFEFEFETWIWF